MSCGCKTADADDCSSGEAIALQVLIYPATDMTRESDSYVRYAQPSLWMSYKTSLFFASSYQQ